MQKTGWVRAGDSTSQGLDSMKKSSRQSSSLDVEGIYNSKGVLYPSKRVLYNSKIVLYHSKIVLYHSKSVLYHSKGSCIVHKGSFINSKGFFFIQKESFIVQKGSFIVQKGYFMLEHVFEFLIRCLRQDQIRMIWMSNRYPLVSRGFLLVVLETWLLVDEMRIFLVCFYGLSSANNTIRCIYNSSVNSWFY